MARTGSVTGRRRAPGAPAGCACRWPIKCGAQAFEALGCLRVEFKTDARNLRSQRALDRIGATREGVMRKHMIVQGGFCRDSVYFSVTDNECPGVKERLRQLRDRC